jgi:processive 1,2-diacylglycerol beta-glucosyltransferase
MNLAQALREALGESYPVVIEDPQARFIHQHYTILSRHFLRGWDWEYRYTDNEVGALFFHRVLNWPSRKRLEGLIEQTRPALIISTHSLLSYAVARTLERMHKRIPLVFQLTDLERVHTTWFTEKCADAYLAPTREIYAQARQQEIEEARLHITGRPVRRQFLSDYTGQRQEVLASLGLDPELFTLFLQGGATGSAGVDRTLRSVLTPQTPVQVILAAGNNREMIAHYSGIKRLHVLPFTPDIAPYMAASDVIAGKVGASFLSEAIMLRKPFLVTTFIPGQEAPTLDFLERYGLGWVRLDPLTQHKLLLQLVDEPGMIKEKVSSISAYRTWNIEANRRLHPLIERLLV